MGEWRGWDVVWSVDKGDGPGTRDNSNNTNLELECWRLLSLLHSEQCSSSMPSEAVCKSHIALAKLRHDSIQQLQFCGSIRRLHCRCLFRVGCCYCLGGDMSTVEL